MCVREGFHHTHTHTHTWNQHIGRMHSHRCSHTPTHARTHTPTHIDIGIGTMGLPSLQAMGVWGGLSLLRTFVMGGGLESCWGRGGGSQGCGRVFFSFFHKWFVLCIKNPTKTNENGHF